MVQNSLRLAVTLIAVAGAALAADMFQASPGNEDAARTLAIVGSAILLFSLSLSVGSLVAGLWRALSTWNRSHRRGSRGLGAT